MAESLFINTLAFEFPKEPKLFYFSIEEKEGVSLTKLSHQLFPCNIKEIFPNISNADTIYTSFDWELEDFQPLPIDFSLNDNFYLIKRYYNKVLYNDLVRCNLIVEPNLITKDNHIWIQTNSDNKTTLKTAALWKNPYSSTPLLLISPQDQKHSISL
jgi:hypothetical protein